MHHNLQEYQQQSDLTALAGGSNKFSFTITPVNLQPCPIKVDYDET
jgi:hypothetical protein